MTDHRAVDECSNYVLSAIVLNTVAVVVLLRAAGTCLRDPSVTPLFFVLGSHRIRINTEGKAKIGAAVWGTEFIQLNATLANLQQED